MDTDLLTRKTSRARGCAFIVLAALGVRLALALTPGETAAAASATRLEWLTACGDAQRLGVYQPQDAACQPGQSVTLDWLERQATQAGLLQAGERLQPAANPAGCLARVLNQQAAVSGQLCAQARGLFRTDNAGRRLGDYWPWQPGIAWE